MKIVSLIDEIYASNTTYDENGQVRDISVTSISREEGEFLRRIVEEPDIRHTVEVGCAYGMSSLFICAGLQDKPERHHTIIDPFQSREWNNTGVNNLKRAGVDYFKLIEKPSELALPELLGEEKSFDFGFIDGWHTLDHTLIDFFYLNRMLRVGGVIVIDDVSFPSINKLMGYLTQYPCYEVIGTINMKSPRRSVEEALTLPLRMASAVLPTALTTRVLAGNIAQKGKKFKLNTSMIALRKVAADERPYDWFAQF